MNSAWIGSESILLKAMCLVLTLIIGSSLFAAGAIGAASCGMTCCCQTGPDHMQTSGAKQMRSSMGCCSGLSFSPCDMPSAMPFGLPKITLTSSFRDLPNIAGSAINLVDFSGNRQISGGYFVAQVLAPRFKSPPLYLTKLSFLI